MPLKKDPQKDVIFLKDAKMLLSVGPNPNTFHTRPLINLSRLVEKVSEQDYTNCFAGNWNYKQLCEHETVPSKMKKNALCPMLQFRNSTGKRRYWKT